MSQFETRSVRCASAMGFHRMVYSVWGPTQARRTVLCVHGLTRNGRDFDFLAQRLSERGYRVLCPDIVGRGRSDRLAPGVTYGIPQYIADITVMLAAEQCDQVAWLGTSMGGLIGMSVGAMANSPIDSLLVNDVGPFIPKAALARIGEYVGIAWRFSSFEEGAAHVKKAYEPFALKAEADWQFLARISLVEDRDQDGAAFWTNNFDLRIAEPFAAGVDDVDLWQLWDAIRCPTRVLRGAESDLLLASTAREMTKRGPKASLVEVPGCGHAPAIMDDEQVGMILDWLA